MNIFFGRLMISLYINLHFYKGNLFRLKFIYNRRFSVMRTTELTLSYINIGFMYSDRREEKFL